MNVKKLLVIAMAFVLLLTGCASSNEWDNSTVTAKVTDIQGRKVTLALGELAMGEGMEKPDFENGERPDFGSGERPQMPEGFEGQMPEGFEMPENFEMPEGGFERPEMGGMDFDMSQLFTENGKTVTVELSQSVVDGIAVDDLVQVTFGEKNSVQNITVMGGGFGGMMPFGSGDFKPEN